MSLIFLAVFWVVQYRPDPDNSHPPAELANSVGPLRSMVKIPAGEFSYGFPPGYRTVLPDFLIDKYEVMQSDYIRCVKAGVCELMNIFSQGDAMPVGGVTWYQANSYCQWLGKRLPTTQEWEKAARGPGGGHKYPWGNEWHPDYANWCDSEKYDDSQKLELNIFSCEGLIDGYVEQAPVNAFPQGSSPYDVMQMCGNQLEWTSTKGSDSSQPGYGDNYVVRGGSWFGSTGMGTPDGTLITWLESSDPPDANPPHLGFRCAKSIP